MSVHMCMCNSRDNLHCKLINKLDFLYFVRMAEELRKEQDIRLQIEEIKAEERTQQCISRKISPSTRIQLALCHSAELFRRNRSHSWQADEVLASDLLFLLQSVKMSDAQLEGTATALLTPDELISALQYNAPNPQRRPSMTSDPAGWARYVTVLPCALVHLEYDFVCSLFSPLSSLLSLFPI